MPSYIIESPCFIVTLVDCEQKQRKEEQRRKQREKDKERKKRLKEEGKLLTPAQKG